MSSVHIFSSQEKYSKWKKNRVHRPRHSSIFSWIICGLLWGSFAVQFGDHLRSGIICGPGIICGVVQFCQFTGGAWVGGVWGWVGFWTNVLCKERIGSEHGAQYLILTSLFIIKGFPNQYCAYPSPSLNPVTNRSTKWRSIKAEFILRLLSNVTVRVGGCIDNMTVRWSFIVFLQGIDVHYILFIRYWHGKVMVIDVLKHSVIQTKIDPICCRSFETRKLFKVTVLDFSPQANIFHSCDWLTVSRLKIAILQAQQY